MNPLMKLHTVEWMLVLGKNAVITADGLDIQRYIFSAAKPLQGFAP